MQDRLRGNQNNDLSFKVSVLISLVARYYCFLENTSLALTMVIFIKSMLDAGC